MADEYTDAQLEGMIQDGVINNIQDFLDGEDAGFIDTRTDEEINLEAMRRKRKKTRLEELDDEEFSSDAEEEESESEEDSFDVDPPEQEPDPDFEVDEEDVSVGHTDSIAGESRRSTRLGAKTKIDYSEAKLQERALQLAREKKDQRILRKQLKREQEAALDREEIEKAEEKLERLVREREISKDSSGRQI